MGQYGSYPRSITQFAGELLRLPGMTRTTGPGPGPRVGEGIGPELPTPMPLRSRMPLYPPASIGMPSSSPGAWLPPRISPPISGGGSPIMPPGTSPWIMPGRVTGGGSYILPPSTGSVGRAGGAAWGPLQTIIANEAAEEAARAGQPTPRGDTIADTIRQNLEAGRGMIGQTIEENRRARQEGTGTIARTIRENQEELARRRAAFQSRRGYLR